MALKKSDLYSTLLAFCHTLRGGMDASQCKDYDQFIKCVSDKYANSKLIQTDFPDFSDPNKLSEWQSELDRVSQTLTRRIRQLVERYATLMPTLEVEVDKLSAKVGEHLKKMGVVWN